jgi:hypothetical protein
MTSNGTVDLQERIAAARREADQLKDQIRSRKEKLADTTRELTELAIRRGAGSGEGSGGHCENVVTDFVFISSCLRICFTPLSENTGC